VLVSARINHHDEMAPDKRFFVIDDEVDEFEFGSEEQYFTYRPLSNLPTPPPSSGNSSANQSPKQALDEDEALSGEFLGMFEVSILDLVNF
jgi:hypothetical protein